MRPHLHQGQIRPKVSTMPRQQTEAAAYLDIYKLVNEKKRLQQELEALGQRRDRIQQRLVVIEQQVEQLEKTAHERREEIAIDTKAIEPKPRLEKRSAESAEFSTLFLEY